MAEIFSFDDERPHKKTSPSDYFDNSQKIIEAEYQGSQCDAEPDLYPITSPYWISGSPSRLDDLKETLAPELFKELQKLGYFWVGRYTWQHPKIYEPPRVRGVRLYDVLLSDTDDRPAHHSVLEQKAYKAEVRGKTIYITPRGKLFVTRMGLKHDHIEELWQYCDYAPMLAIAIREDNTFIFEYTKVSGTWWPGTWTIQKRVWHRWTEQLIKYDDKYTPEYCALTHYKAAASHDDESDTTVDRGDTGGRAENLTGSSFDRFSDQLVCDMDRKALLTKQEEALYQLLKHRFISTPGWQTAEKGEKSTYAYIGTVRCARPILVTEIAEMLGMPYYTLRYKLKAIRKKFEDTSNIRLYAYNKATGRTHPVVNIRGYKPYIYERGADEVSFL